MQDVTSYFDLTFRFLEDFAEVLDQTWYARNQARFHGKQPDPHHVVMKISKLSQENRQLRDFRSTCYNIMEINGLFSALYISLCSFQTLLPSLINGDLIFQILGSIVKLKIRGRNRIKLIRHINLNHCAQYGLDFYLI